MFAGGFARLRAVRFVLSGVVFLAVLAFAAGCGGESGSEGDPTATDDAPAASGSPGEDTLSRVQQSGEIVVGVRYDQPPFSSAAEEDEEPEGFEVDLARAVAERMGVEATFEPVTGEDRMDALRSGEVDLVVATMTHTRVRDETIDFSITYFEDGQRLLVPEGSEVRSVGGLAGRTVATAAGSTSEVNIRRAAPEAEVTTHQSYRYALDALLAGEADAVTTDGAILSGLERVAEESGGNVEIVGESFSREPYGMGVRHGDSALQDVVNFALMELVEEGRYQEIRADWFEEGEVEPFTPEVWPAGP